ncbi:DoxX family protein [Gordonia sp. DT30]|uniref:DoxX family protein n=1 Tax=unclassified Gordonia (in: high G+C Gram-positive bacteria) TaxID=2657482 RepID=UPI003CFB326F
MSDREPSDPPDQTFQPSSPYDEPTGAFRVPEMSDADRDTFYERHRRRLGRLSRVDSLDDLDPGEIETTPIGVPPPSSGRRNPAPMPPPHVRGSADDPGPSEAPTAPTETAGPTPTPAEPPTAKLDPAPPIPSVEATFPELSRTRRAQPSEPDDATRGLRHDEEPLPVTMALGEPEVGPGRDETDWEKPGQGGRDETYRDQPEAPVRAPRGTLDLGLLLFRLAIGSVALAHGLQKLFGLWGGPGLSGYQDMLVNNANPAIGFNADAARPLAIVGALSETIGGAMVILGLFTPIGACAVLAVMLLAAAYRTTLSGGGFLFFAPGGGIEYELVLAVAAAALILTGPGLYSFDAPRRWARRPFLGSVAWLIVGIGAAVAVWMVFNGTNPLQSPGNPR